MTEVRRRDTWWNMSSITEKMVLAVCLALAGWVYSMSERVTRLEVHVETIQKQNSDILTRIDKNQLSHEAGLADLRRLIMQLMERQAYGPKE